MLPPAFNAYLESLILENPFNGSIFARRRQFSLKHDPKGPISHDFALRVLQVSSLPSDSILYLLPDDFCRHCLVG